MGYPTRPSNVRVYQFRQPPGFSRMILPAGRTPRQRPTWQLQEEKPRDPAYIAMRDQGPVAGASAERVDRPRRWEVPGCDRPRPGPELTQAGPAAARGQAAEAADQGRDKRPLPGARAVNSQAASRLPIGGLTMRGRARVWRASGPVAPRFRAEA